MHGPPKHHDGVSRLIANLGEVPCRRHPSGMGRLMRGASFDSFLE